MATRIKFYPKSHTYRFGKQKLTSVTTFISQYFAPFEKKKIAKLKAFLSRRAGDMEKATQRYWIQHWKQLTDHGTRVHDCLERYVRGEALTEQEREEPKVLCGIQWFDENYLTGDRVEAEKIVYNTDLGLAGTVDLVIHKKEGLHLVDWKTNKEIKSEGYRGQKAREPLSHMEDCNLSKYSLQLNIYAHMLALEGYTIDKLTLVHLTDTGYVEYDIPIMYKEIWELFTAILKDENK